MTPWPTNPSTYTVIYPNEILGSYYGVISIIEAADQFLFNV